MPETAGPKLLDQALSRRAIASAPLRRVAHGLHGREWESVG